MIVADIIQKVQLVEGQFTPQEALQVITSLLDEKINYHKLNRLSKVIGDHDADCRYSEKRIEELEVEKRVAIELIKEARKSNSELRINGTLELTFVKQQEEVPVREHA